MVGWAIIMVLELDTWRCANQEAVPQREVDMRQCASKDVGPRRMVDWGVPHQLEKITSASENARPRREWILRSHVG